MATQLRAHHRGEGFGLTPGCCSRAARCVAILIAATILPLRLSARRIEQHGDHLGRRGMSPAAPAVDLYSDTVTRPTAAMRRFMCDAEVGDEQQCEDPTVNRLQEMVAELLGKEAALFLPSGTMCNQVAFAVHCRAGDEILLHETAHPLLYEAGGAAALIGAVFHPLPGPRGHVHGRAGAPGGASRGALHAADPGGLDRADGQHRGRRLLAARGGRGGVRRRRARPAWRGTWTARG